MQTDYINRLDTIQIVSSRRIIIGMLVYYASDMLNRTCIFSATLFTREIWVFGSTSVNHISHLLAKCGKKNIYPVLSEEQTWPHLFAELSLEIDFDTEVWRIQIPLKLIETLLTESRNLCMLAINSILQITTIGRCLKSALLQGVERFPCEDWLQLVANLFVSAGCNTATILPDSTHYPHSQPTKIPYPREHLNHRSIQLFLNAPQLVELSSCPSASNFSSP